MKRGFKNMIFEILTPVLFVIAGFGLIKLTFLNQSPERKLQTKLFPLPQRILVNEYPIIDSDLFHFLKEKRQQLLDEMIDDGDRDATLDDVDMTEVMANITELYNQTKTEALIDQLPSSYTLLSDYDFIVTYQDYRDLLAFNEEVDALNAEIEIQNQELLEEGAVTDAI